MKIGILGDLFIEPTLLPRMEFDGKLVEKMAGLDLNIVNLESPVVSGPEPGKIFKTGPHLKTGSKIYDVLRLLNVDVLTLANNHILDYGEEGLRQTLESSAANGFKSVGAGMDLDRASEPLLLSFDCLKIAIVNFCENEWSTASKEKGGANPMDVVRNVRQIRMAREGADFVLAIIHGGHERYRLPSPRMVEQYRFYAESGADMVVGHHSHCFSGYEIHGETPIFYSLGNMLFTYETDFEGWYSGLMIVADIGKGKKVSFEVESLWYDRSRSKLRLAEPEEEREMRGELEWLNAVVGDSEELEKSWATYVDENSGVLDAFSPFASLKGRYARAFFRRLRVNEFLLNRKEYIGPILNRVRCEAHRDLVIAQAKKRLE